MMSDKINVNTYMLPCHANGQFVLTASRIFVMRVLS